MRYAPGDDIPDAEAKKLGLVDGAPPEAKAESKAEAATTKAQKPAEDKGA